VGGMRRRGDDGVAWPNVRAKVRGIRMAEGAS
jgi:hypothetical protein